MPKLYSAREIVVRLTRIGFMKVSQKGSHIKMRGIRDGKLQTAMIPDHKEIALGTLGSILKQASITKKEIDEA